MRYHVRIRYSPFYCKFEACSMGDNTIRINTRISYENQVSLHYYQLYCNILVN